MGNLHFITAISIYTGFLISPLACCFSASEAGIKVRIQENGFEYLKDTLLDLLMDMLVSMPIPPMKFQQMNVKDIKIVGVTKPRKSQLILTPPDTISVKIETFNIRTRGRFSGFYLIPIPSGEFDATASGIRMRQNLRVTNKNGTLAIQPDLCYIEIPTIEIDLKNAVYNLFRTRIAEELRAPMIKRFCSAISDIISGISNSSLQSLPKQFPLTEFGGNSKILKKYLKHLYLDYRLIEFPKVYSSQLQLDFSGEVLWRGKKRTTLERNAINFPNPPPAVAKSKMSTSVFSQYVMNSMFESLHRNTRLKFEVDGKTHPKLADLLRTTCDVGKGDLSFCIGDFLVGLAEKFPNKDLGLRFTPVKRPEVSFRQDVINFKSKGPLIMYYIQKWETVNVARSIMDISMDAKVKTLPNGTIAVNIEDADIKIRARSSSFNTDQDEFDVIGDFAGASLQEIFGEFTLFNEIPLPIKASMKLTDPIISVRDGAIDIFTDFEINRSELQNVLKEMIDKNMVSKDS